MSGTWTRRRRGTTTTGIRREERPLPPSTTNNQQQVVRSLDKVFEEAQETGVLSLSSRKLKEYPEGISTKFNLTDLVAIDVSDNRLVELPLVVCEYSSLETLDARENLLRRTPASISLLHALTYIDLSCNQLRDLPSSLFDLPIRIALLGGNLLESLPRMTRATSNSLVHLDISYNKFRLLPTDISLLSALRILNVSHNKLETFPSELCSLTLHTLDLSSNLLPSLPLQLSNMRCIKRLTVIPNPLVAPPLSVVEKGREHIFKWLSVQSNQEEGWRFSASGGVATLRSFNSNSLLISSGWRDRRSGGLTRGTTVTESTVTAEEKKENSDEGFVSAPTSKASPSSISNDSSTSACASYSHCVPSSSSSSTSDVSNDFTGLLKVYDKKMASVVEKNEKEETIGVKCEMERKDKVEKAAIKRNDSVRAPSHPITRVSTPSVVSTQSKSTTVSSRPLVSVPPPTVTSTPPSHSTPPPPPVHSSSPSSTSSPSTTKQRPVSKVAPMQSSPMTRSVVEKREVKGVDKKVLSPSTTNGIKGRNGSTTNASITTVTRSPSMSRRVSSVSSSSTTSSTRPSGPIRVAPTRGVNGGTVNTANNSISNAKRPTPSSSVRPAPPSSTTARPSSGNNNSSTPSSTASSRSNSVTTSINNNTLNGSKNTTMTSSVVRRATNGVKSVPSAAPSDTVVVDRMKKIIDQRCGTSVDSLPVSSLSSRLSDGVILCQLAHSFHPAVCTSIALPDKNTPLASIKCKKNVESFLDACKELRVKPLLSCEDILGRRNLPYLARMITALSKTTANLPVSHL